ncbi:class I SAM-dependent methyltransferase [Clostridium sp. SHJSY1]|uniref:class I SAM-dependent methyltransferase n=1 Tax=Clostridium sp. SHJSY1 TaxID=2942483 RepID=UPI0028742A0F|nr:class I SAM-dependent methyltransferase [Clostridium sp. SHJSY1]MDS0526138.1 class I SAM-dependent methyltransferase [Clostridium sp. SHJSY1]
MNGIQNWYDNLYDEWERLDYHKIEFDITKRYLDKFIVGKNLEIFDIGGGPGRYSLYLAEKDHKVTLLDLSQKNIEVAKTKAKEFNIELEEYIHGNALELDKYNQKYDVILLMGPLYHLIKEDDRRLVLKNALRLLKSDGIIVVSFISKYAPIQDNLTYLCKIKEINDLFKYLENGENKEEDGFTTAYFSGPKEARKFLSNYNIKELVFAGVENILGCKEKEICLLEEEQYNKWIDVGFRLSTDENLIGTSQHFLYIGQKR